ncbi:MAG: AbrB/MazE/SpoVT family DNA-binding domain-containing protein, partial [Pseudomonadota bacterium]
QQAKLEECELEFEILPQGLLIKPHQEKKRKGWEEAFKNAVSLEREEIIEVTNTFDSEDWSWPMES